MDFLSHREMRVIKISCVNANEIAVLSANYPHANTIMVLYVRNAKLTVKRNVSFAKNIMGMTVCKDKFVINTWYFRSSGSNSDGGSFDLVDLDGNVYWSREKDNQGQDMFSQLCHLGSYTNGELPTIVVFDSLNKRIVLLNGETGDIINVKEMTNISPLTADNIGNIYYICRTPNNIVTGIGRVSQDLSEERRLSADGDLRWQPLATEHDGTCHQLLISYWPHQDYGNYVDLFKLN